MGNKRRRTVSICYTHADGATETKIERERAKHHTGKTTHKHLCNMYIFGF